VRMVVDISCSDRTSLDALAVLHKPVLVTHSNCRALVAHPRCKPDAVIRQLAARGGVMGITLRLSRRDQQIELILGGNFQQAMTEIEDVKPAAPKPT
jgi:hypothetical protein